MEMQYIVIITFLFLAFSGAADNQRVLCGKGNSIQILSLLLGQHKELYDTLGQHGTQREIQQCFFLEPLMEFASMLMPSSNFVNILKEIKH
jgi:hypothetical protein